MIKFGIFLALLVCWFFGTMLKVNEKADSKAAFIWKSVFFWTAVGIAYSLGSMR